MKRYNMMYKDQEWPDYNFFEPVHHDHGDWVPASVAQALYDALRYVYEGQGAQDFTTLNSEEFDVMRKALSLAGGETE